MHLILHYNKHIPLFPLLFPWLQCAVKERFHVQACPTDQQHGSMMIGLLKAQSHRDCTHSYAQASSFIIIPKKNRIFTCVYLAQRYLLTYVQ